ncbi:S-adenosyl-L-methionine-dependent methyltransferase [Exophiala viscosa]|uniref:S-adenosyl-L-methionine-dependent methyltransferase n=1 Tax=Exophiala viscosa TaxID=2486360 RepID=A0AAN6IDU9_9EURO|nr:S-adenosyl-L-methionine-dependent methyltransferase [Exophiala viscosa]
MADPDAKKQLYFTQIAPGYSRVTGNTTKDLFNEVLQSHDLSINSDSVIHDNAAGPGTATEALISWCHQHNVSPKIIVTDYVPAMVDACEAIRTKHADDSLWQSVAIAVADSAYLKEFADDYFTHSICNFSIFTFTHPTKCLQEIRRTLRPGGVTLVTCWKRFAVSEVIAAAQDQVKGSEWGEAHRMPVNGPEYMQEGHTAKLVREAGFEEEKTQSFAAQTVVKRGEDWDGLYEFLLNPFIKSAATKEWSEQELGRWPEAVNAALEMEEQSYGGILFEAWVKVARK